MSKPIYNLTLRGGLGNCMFQYAHARKLAELEGAELRTTEWVGPRVFRDVPSSPIVSGEGTDLPLDYRQTQADLIYTRRDCRRWFEFQAWVDDFLHNEAGSYYRAAHLRRGDYAAAGFVLVSFRSYQRLLGPGFKLVTDENVPVNACFRDGLSCIPDFYALTRVAVIARANSTFSWWAATLSTARIYSPVI